MNSDPSAFSAAICRRYGVRPVDPDPQHKVGISQSALDGIQPLNGLRHHPEAGTSGWYIWGGPGEPGKAPDFFLPMHMSHLSEKCADVVPYLCLPPGWRFLIAPGHEDVWEDASLLGAK